MLVCIAQILDQTESCAARLASCYRSEGNHLVTLGFWNRDYQDRDPGWDVCASVVVIRDVFSLLRQDTPRLWGWRIASADKLVSLLYPICHGNPHTTRSALTRADFGFVMR
jgi:hypothetical protein